MGVDAMRIADLAGVRILIVGDVCTDVWIRVDEARPKEGETKRLTIVGETERPGMAGCAVAAARICGMRVVSEFSPMQTIHLKRTRYLWPEGRLYFRVDQNRETTISRTYLDQVYDAAKTAAENLALTVDSWDAILCCDHGYGFFPDADHCARWVNLAHKYDIPIVVDPRPNLAGFGWWKGADVIKANEAESRARKGWEEVATYLVITSGERGWSMLSGRRRETKGAGIKTAGLTVGAGDAFAVALAGAIGKFGVTDENVAAGCELANRFAAFWVGLDKLRPEIDIEEVRAAVDGTAKKRIAKKAAGR